ncbi:hypothetical protein [Bacillus sp. FJAT-44742]|uniref:hypothetical protein n=1 Tax=Bacillus sp. FJAT-44742 TaxID=2014005 RepID=UPI000C242EF3|nr:hypothetical protein [Bacillus sp. FJAT-44742]
MFEKVKFSAWTLVFIGAIMLIIDFEAMWMYALSAMIVGIILHVIASLVVKKDKPLLCRVGFHNYEHKGYDQELKSVRVYVCKRCGYQKKAMLGGAG